jgi:peptidyl-prolyl cis-trans isomerase C
MRGSSWVLGVRPSVTSSFLCACFLGVLFAVSGCNKTEEDAKQQETDAAREQAAPAAQQADAVEAQSVAPDAVVVDVDGAVLKRSELDQQLMRALSAQGMQGMPPQSMGPEIMAQFENDITDRFIAQHVLLNEAVRRKIEASDEEVEKTIKDLVDGLPEGITLQTALEQHGMTEAKFRADVVSDVRIRKMLEEETKEVAQPTDEEVKKFYDESPQFFKVGASAKTRHILVECREGESEEKHAEKRKEAEALLKQIEDGADFAVLAKEKSSCPSGQKGGSLGEVKKGQMVKEFEDAVFSQDLNKVGPVVKTQFGYHLIEVQERTEEKTEALAEVKEKISGYLTDQKKQEVVEAFIEGLKAKATITRGSKP